ncbi:MAG: hypothetical protein Q9167_005580 [Letrouitia subvulpina]
MNETLPQNEFAGPARRYPNTSVRNYTWQPTQGIKFDGKVQQQTRQLSRDNASSRPGFVKGAQQVITEDAKHRTPFKAHQKPTLESSMSFSSTSADEKSPQVKSSLLASYTQDYIAPPRSQRKEGAGITFVKDDHRPKLHDQVSKGYTTLMYTIDHLAKQGILKSTKGLYIEDELRQLRELRQQMNKAMHLNRADHTFKQAIVLHHKLTGVERVIAQKTDKLVIVKRRSYDQIDESISNSVFSIRNDVLALKVFLKEKRRRQLDRRYHKMVDCAIKLAKLRVYSFDYRVWRNKSHLSQSLSLFEACSHSLTSLVGQFTALRNHRLQLLMRFRDRHWRILYRIKRRARFDKHAGKRWFSKVTEMRAVLHELAKRERRKSTIAELSTELIPDESLSTNELLHLKQLGFIQGKDDEHSLHRLDKQSLNLKMSGRESDCTSTCTSALGFQRTQPLGMSNLVEQLPNAQGEPNQGRTDGENVAESSEPHYRSPLGYHIPSNRLRASLRASEATGAAYWQYILYESPKGEKVKVHYCKSKETTERIAQLFLGQKILGFDVEWKAQASAQEGIRKNVALIQIASEERIALFHVARFSNEDTIEDLVAPSLKRIMESSDITKVGVSVRGDSTRLRKYLGFESRGLFELSHLYKLVKFSTGDVKKINKVLVSLASQVQEHLMLPLFKDQRVRASDWSEDLNYQQIYYAASDSYAGFQLFHILNSKRQELDPVPPLPSHLELNLPIRLANGQTVADYEESQEPQAEDPPSNPQSESQTSLSLPSDQLNRKFLNLAIEDSPLTTATASSGIPKSLGSPPSLSSHPSVVAANNWVLAYRTDSPASGKNNNPKPRATPAFLRAYSLFHVQGKPVAEIAALLRNPPLKEATVAQYVLEAVKLERLDIEGPRLEECLGCLGDTARGRYRGLVKRTGAVGTTGIVDSRTGDQACQLAV